MFHHTNRFGFSPQNRDCFVPNSAYLAKEGILNDSKSLFPILKLTVFQNQMKAGVNFCCIVGLSCILRPKSH